MKLNRRACLRLGLLAGAGRASAARPAGAGGAAPSAAFDTLDMDWADTTRQRAVPVPVPVPVRMYLPHGMQALPLLVFSHGIGGSRRW